MPALGSYKSLDLLDLRAGLVDGLLYGFFAEPTKPVDERIDIILGAHMTGPVTRPRRFPRSTANQQVGTCSIPHPISYGD